MDEKRLGFPNICNKCIPGWIHVYAIFTYMKTIKNQQNVGKDTSPMDPMGM